MDTPTGQSRSRTKPRYGKYSSRGPLLLHYCTLFSTAMESKVYILIVEATYAIATPPGVVRWFSKISATC